MDEPLGWTLYVSISAAVAFFVAGYVLRSAVTLRRDRAREKPDGAGAEKVCCEAHTVSCEKASIAEKTAPVPVDEAETLVGRHLEVVAEEEPFMDEAPPAADPQDDERARVTPARWPPEQSVGLPPMSCPPSSQRRDAFSSETFPAEASTRPFHGTTSQQVASERHHDQREAIERLEREVRRLAGEQGALDRRIEELSERIEPPHRRVRLGSGAPDLPSEPFSQAVFLSLLDAMPVDVSVAVVADSLGLPLAHRGEPRACTEIAASLGHVKQLARAVASPAGLRPPVRRVQLDDCAGGRLDCWLVETNEGPYGVMLVRRSGAPDGDVEQRVEQIAAALGAVDPGCASMTGL